MSRPPASLPSDTLAATGDRRVFHIQSCLGRGGFGEVYRATMVGAGGVRMEVAVKVLHAEVDPQSQAVQRLRDEARLLGAIRHPSVLAVHGLVVLDGRVTLVTEYVEGADLDKCVRGEDPISRRALVEMIGRVAEALDAAWCAPSPEGSGPLRLVHRDIKPANIRLGRHGEVKLLDFGIARAGNLEREARTETNAMLGSYLYMAPERFLDGSDHGPAIDVFALGCTLYECVAGQRLFGELALKDLYLLILDDQRYERFVQERLDLLPRDLEPELVSLIYRMVALSPRERPSHPELARATADLADRMKGRTLDRWARGRTWPAPKQVRGVLDGVSVTESHLSAAAPLPAMPTTFAPVGAEPIGAISGSFSKRRARGAEPGDTFEGVLSRTVSATLERPTMVVGMGFGVIGLGAVAAAVVLLIASLAFLVWQSSRPAPPAPTTVAAVPETPVPAAAPPPPPPVAPAPEAPPVVVAPPPVAPPSSAGDAPAPIAAPPPEPVVVVVAEPAPTPAPTPPKPPVAEQNATVMLVGQSKVLVEFKGPNGTTRSRSLPPGQYDVVAWFGGKPAVVTNSTNFLSAGGTYRLNCSDLMQTCTWVK